MLNLQPNSAKGPLTTTDDAASEPSDIESSKSVEAKKEAGSNIFRKHDEEEELEPVRDQPDAVDNAGGIQRVPKALHMRFQAELHQMEAVEEAERQLNQLNRLRDVATARNEAVTAATYAQVQWCA